MQAQSSIGGPVASVIVDGRSCHSGEVVVGDVCIVGGGPAGHHPRARAHRVGDEGRPGGVRQHAQEIRGRSAERGRRGTGRLRSAVAVPAPHARRRIRRLGRAMRAARPDRLRGPRARSVERLAHLLRRGCSPLPAGRAVLRGRRCDDGRRSGGIFCAFPRRILQRGSADLFLREVQRAHQLRPEVRTGLAGGGFGGRARQHHLHAAALRRRWPHRRGILCDADGCAPAGAGARCS